MTDPPRVVVARAAAKINLYLGVGAPRADGFHPLTTVYQAISLYDDLTARAGSEHPGWTVAVRVAPYVDAAALPAAGENIVDRAAAALAAHHGRVPTGRVEVVKQIPVAGGLAGGSADAAAALVALDALWELGSPVDVLRELAADLGSDVPFALVGGTALGTGRGERVDPVVDSATWWWVVVPSAVGLSTPAVYRHFDALFPQASSTPAPADELLAALATRDPVRLAVALHNDLQAPALDLRPDLAVVLERGEAAGALRGLVSGSGPTCLFLCASEAAAVAVAAELRAVHPVALVAHGPVPGAGLVTSAVAGP